jgi:hypothetical protein
VKKVISNTALRALCEKNKWCTEATSGQYEKLFQANSLGCSLHELSAIIWFCSDSNANSREAIAEEIKETRQGKLTARYNQIVEFIERKVPADWHKWDIEHRRDFWEGMSYTTEGSVSGLIQREQVCAMEIWCELLNGEPDTMLPEDAKEINNIIKATKQWGDQATPYRFGPYAVQRGFVRCK